MADLSFGVLYEIKNRGNFRSWLEENSEKEKECYVVVKRGEPKGDDIWYYSDAVYEAICFGWIDSVTRRDLEGRMIQRFSPRRKNSNWTELNKERARKLKELGLMTKYGEKTLPDLEKRFVVDEDIMKIFAADGKFLEMLKELPDLYFRVRVDNIQKVRKDSKYFSIRLKKFIDMTKLGKLYGDWNDYGRLI